MAGDEKGENGNGGRETEDIEDEEGLTTSGAKGLFLKAPPTARGLEPRAAERAL